MKEKVYWFIGSEAEKEYKTVTWYRCPGIRKFVDLIEKKKNKIAALVVGEDNNIGFILDTEKRK